MRRMMVVVVVAVLAACGCTTKVVVNPLSHELGYHMTPDRGVEKPLDKSIAVLPLVDQRVLTETGNVSTSTCLLVGLIPGVFYVTGESTHPEVEYNTTVGLFRSRVMAAGTLGEAVPKLLADYLHRSGRYSKVQFVESADLARSQGLDFVLRGELKEAKLTAKQWTYCIGPLAYVAYLLGAPITRYEATLTVDWQLYDSSGKAYPATGKPKTAAAGPVKQWVGVYYGHTRNEKNVPIGLYVDLVRDVCRQVAAGLKNELFEPVE